MTLLRTATRPEAWAFVGRLLRLRRGRLVAAGALYVGAALAGLVGPRLLGELVDLVREGDAAGRINWFVGALVVAALVEGLLSWAAPVVGSRAVEPALAEVREQVVERALSIPLADVERAGTGDLVARVDDDVTTVSETASEALPQILGAGLTIGLTLLGMTVLDWRLGLAAACAVPVQLHTLRWYLPRSSPIYAAERVAGGARSQQLLEAIGSASTVRALGLGARQERLVADRSGEAVALVLAATRLRTRFFARLNLAEVIGLSAILATGFVLVRDDTVTVGQTTAAALYFLRLFDPVNVLLYLLDEAQSATAALARLVGVAELPPPVVPTATAPHAGPLHVEAVSFAYDDEHLVVHDLSIEVAPGEHVAVVGTSGAGKSTLAKLVAGVERATTGEVRIGSDPVASLASIGGRLPVALVTQEVHVFAGPLADDLRLAAPTASDDELRAALDQVGAGPWVEALPDGLATVVGDGGETLTALQAQQVALARMVLVGPAVVVLDEASAEAGSTGAHTLDAAAERALAGRSALVIAHRLSQAALADRIVVLDHGRKVEDGTHAELLAAGGAYARLWDAWSDGRPDRDAPDSSAPG